MIHIPSSGVRISVTRENGPKPIVPTLTEQLYTVYGCRPETVIHSCEVETFLLSVENSD